MHVSHGYIKKKKNPGFPSDSVVKKPPAMQKTRIRFLIQEDPIFQEAARSMCHNYWACALEPGSHNYWAQMSQLLKPEHPGAHAP